QYVQLIGCLPMLPSTQQGILTKGNRHTISLRVKFGNRRNSGERVVEQAAPSNPGRAPLCRNPNQLAVMIQTPLYRLPRVSLKSPSRPGRLPRNRVLPNGHLSSKTRRNAKGLTTTKKAVNKVSWTLSGPAPVSSTTVRYVLRSLLSPHTLKLVRTAVSFAR